MLCRRLFYFIKRKKRFSAFFFSCKFLRENKLVAEAGIAPAPGGYEPPELLLLYPALLL